MLENMLVTAISSVVSALIGALIGTYLAAKFIRRDNEVKLKQVRGIAIHALNIIKKYKMYADAKQEFNATLNNSEKRAVLVALYKLGVPVSVNNSSPFNIKNIEFDEYQIDNAEINGMEDQIHSGNCDHLFFTDVESYFNDNIRIQSIRSIAKRYADIVLRYSEFEHATGSQKSPAEWFKRFTGGELNIIYVFRYKTCIGRYYDADGKPDSKEIDLLMNEIDLGIWDKYLQWDIVEYENLYAQSDMRTLFQRFVNLPAANVNSSEPNAISGNNTIKELEK